jgi:hypothetical protein
MPEPDLEPGGEISRTPDGSAALERSFSRSRRQLSSRIQGYLDALAQLRLPDGRAPASIILFGSAAAGAFMAESSDVDIIVVLPDDVRPEERSRARQDVSALEIAHGFQLPETRARSRLEKFAERAAGHAMSCFICTRGDLLSGEAARILGLRPAEAFFVDRIVLSGIIVSAVTVRGEELLSQVPMLPLRRLDVFKALFNSANVMLMSAAAFPVLPDATRYAMGLLKHSLHSCYFCYHLKTAPIQEEIDFFQSQFRQSRALGDLLEQRRTYQRSFPFVLRCLPALFRLHLRTARDNRFPRAVARLT